MLKKIFVLLLAVAGALGISNAAYAEEVYVLSPSGDSTGQKDRAAFNKISKTHQNEDITIQFEPGETYYIDASLWLWNNVTVRGDGATIIQVTNGKNIFINAYFSNAAKNTGDVYDGILYGKFQGLSYSGGKEDNKGESFDGTTPVLKVGGYNRCSNITIDGGRYIVTGKPADNASKKADGYYPGYSNFLFMHGNNITVKNCSIENSYNGHMIEYAGINGGTISNVRIVGSYTGDESNEAIQIDSNFNSGVSPTGAPWDGTITQGISIKDCIINVPSMPVGIGSNSRVADGKTFSNLTIENNIISSNKYTLAMNHCKSSTFKNNSLYKGTYSVKNSSNITESGNTQKSNSALSENDSKQITLKDSDVTLSCDTWYYTGSEIKPAVTVKSNGTKLTEDKDYSLWYSNNTNTGTATVKVVGKGAKYMGVVSKTFKIISGDGSATELSIDTSPANVVVGKTATLKYTLKPGNPSAEIKWSSSDTSVVKVSNAKLTGVSVGKATVTLSCGNKSDSVDVRVQFSDVKDPSKFYYDNVYWGVDNGIIGGWSDGTFRPMETCNRAAVVAFLWRMEGQPEPKLTESPFSDVTSSNQFYKAILWAYENDIVTGYDDGEFKPWNKCNRAAIVAFLYRYAGEPSYAGTASDFSDVKNSNQFYDAIMWAAENGIVTGFDGGSFKPWDTCKRLAVAAFLNRYADLDK